MKETLAGTHDDAQINWVYNQLLSGRKLSAKDAFPVGITRLSAIIWDLKHKYNIPVETEYETYINWAGRNARFVRYYIND